MALIPRTQLIFRDDDGVQVRFTEDPEGSQILQLQTRDVIKNKIKTKKLQTMGILKSWLYPSFGKTAIGSEVGYI